LIIPSGLAYGPAAQNNIPANSILRFDVELVSKKDAATVAKEAEDARKAQQEKAEADKKLAAELMAKDDSLIKAFVKENNLNATRTASGLYYVITQEGTSPGPKVNDEVTMNYTGMLLDGKKFDSNVDSAFNHVSPFVFPLGQGRVIRGWDEGVALLKKGAKAKLIIPSGMAYGARGSGANIPPNAVLQFDVEVVDFKKGAEPAPQQMMMNGQKVQKK
jgi:FKBP-type peptidyl-prolyl cis-trans isomerase FkpA